MKSFSRVLRRALAHRWMFGASVFCSLAVALLWGANIGTLFPFVEIVFKGDSMHEWIDHQIDNANNNIKGFEADLAAAQAGGQGKEIARAQSRLNIEIAARDRYEFYKVYINRYLPTTAFQTLLMVVGFLFVGTLVKHVFLISSTLLVDRLTCQTTLELRNDFYRHTIEMDLASFAREGTSQLMSRFTNDMSIVEGGIRTVCGRAIREPLKMIACLIGAGLICWRLLLLSLILAPLAGLLVNQLNRSLKRANRRALEEMSSLYSLLEETFTGIKIVKAFCMERYEQRRFRRTAGAYFARSMKIARYNALVRPATELMGIVTICLAMLGGAYLVLNNETSLLGIKMSDRPLQIGELLLFFGLLAGVSDPGRKLSDVYTQLQRAFAAAERIYEMLDRQSAIVAPTQPIKLPRHRREILFESVTFGYDPDHPVLHNIDLRVQQGQTIALVGPNGCGKSTLANLVPRLFDPVQGRILIDGVDLRQVRIRDLRRQIGMVTQESLLFDDTIYNNIRYGSPRATRQEVIEAAKAAHAHQFIETRLEDGYETLAGSMGNRLSGGQRQRVALARAILCDPAILILDEATSQIDLESEQLIHKVLETFTRGRTTLVITHRLATLALADRVVVLDGGHIADTGTHEELIGRCEIYRRLYQIHLRQSA